MLLSGEVRSLADAWQLSRLPVAGFATFAARHAAVPQLKRVADFLGTGSHNAETIMQDLAMRLATIGVLDERVRAVTCGSNEIDMRRVVNVGGDIFVLELPEEDALRLRPLTNLFVTELFEDVIHGADRSPEGRLATPLAFICDEFATAVGKIPDFENKVNTLRSRRAALICATQSLNQLDLVYGPASRPLLDGFSSLVTIGSLSEADRLYVSQKAGTLTVRQWSETEEFDPNSGEFQPKSRSESLVARPLLLPSDLVREPHPIFGPMSVLFLPQRPPILAHLAPAWEIPWLEQAMARAKSDPGLTGARRRPLRSRPLRAPTSGDAGAPGAAPTGSAPFTDTRGWPADRIRAALEQRKAELDWANTKGSARRWWEMFERENVHRLGLVLRLVEELCHRKATITEFFLAYVYSNCDNIQANLHYLDYIRLKKKTDRPPPENDDAGS